MAFSFRTARFMRCSAAAAALTPRPGWGAVGYLAGALWRDGAEVGSTEPSANRSAREWPWASRDPRPDRARVGHDPQIRRVIWSGAVPGAGLAGRLFSPIPKGLQ